MNVATLAKSGDLIKILEVGKICRRPYPKPCLVLMGRAERSAYQDLRHDNPSPGESAVVEHEMDHVWPVGSFVIRLDSILRGTKGCKYSVNILKANFMQFGIVCCERAHRGGYQLTRNTWSQIRICPVTAARFHPPASLYPPWTISCGQMQAAVEIQDASRIKHSKQMRESVA